jgi:uncharacterized protein DUF4397
MALRGRNTLSIGLALAFLMLVMGPAAAALASAQVRLVNARGASGVSLQVAVNGQKTAAGSPLGYGQVGALANVPAGSAQLSVGGKSVSERLADGKSYTVVALPKNGVEVLRNGSAKPGQARIRVVHAAPELGMPDVKLDQKTIAQGVKFRSATGYLTVDPGGYSLAVTKPNGGATVFRTRVALAAGTATTVVVAGSGGNPERLIVVNDGTVMPKGAPHTGFGGLAGGGGAPWLWALLAAMLAGSLGGAAQVTRARRGRS